MPASCREPVGIGWRSVDSIKIEIEGEGGELSSEIVRVEVTGVHIPPG